MTRSGREPARRRLAPTRACAPNSGLPEIGNTKCTSRVVPAWLRQGEDFRMRKTLVSLGCGAAAMVALAIAPANAADELEAKLQACNACHGQNGQPIDKSIPIIWGQTTAYLTKQLHDYRGEDRNNPVMSQFAAMIKPEEWRKVATYF